MPSLFGRKRSFRSKAAAEQFVRHLTRELTAGGIAHWVEIAEVRESVWVPIVHRGACPGADKCECAQD